MEQIGIHTLMPNGSLGVESSASNIENLFFPTRKAQFMENEGKLNPFRNKNLFFTKMYFLLLTNYEISVLR